MAGKLVSYYRVSTKQQGSSGLGLEGQEAAVRAYSGAAGCAIIGAYTEVETGTKAKTDNRPELVRALAHAKFAKATLIIAKLDRLSRNVAFLSNLMESGAEFVACDNPTANRLTIHILAAVAEDEARRISERTKAALAAYKARGGKLGASLEQCRSLTDAGRKAGAANAGRVHSEAADRFNTFIAPRVVAMRAEGMTLKAIAAALNAEGVQTRRGKDWTHVQILNILRRYGPTEEDLARNGQASSPGKATG